MINVMINTGQIEIGGREHGGKGWEDWIWRGQQKIVSPFYLVLFSLQLCFGYFGSLLVFSQIKSHLFISLGIHALLFIVSVGSDILSLEGIQFLVFLLTLAVMACFLGFMFIC